MLFSLWALTHYRATGDLDLLGLGDNAPAAIASIFVEFLSTPVEDDGVLFKLQTLRAVPAREEDEYAGVRLNFIAELAGAQLPVQVDVDVGYGDAITPGPVEIDYPSLLGQPTARLRSYPPETVVAEKFQAMLMLGMVNTRMKDFFDVWAIAGTFSFDGAVFARVIRATIERRGTALPVEMPMALTASFAGAKQGQWAAFLRRTEIALTPEPLLEIQARIAAFVMPPTIAMANSAAFDARWATGRPWSRID